MTTTEFDDPRVAAGAVFEARADAVEQFLNHGLVVNDAQDLPARVQVAALAQRDHALNPAAQFLGLGVGGLDFFLAQQRGDKITH